MQKHYLKHRDKIERVYQLNKESNDLCVIKKTTNNLFKNIK